MLNAKRDYIASDSKMRTDLKPTLSTFKMQRESSSLKVYLT